MALPCFTGQCEPVPRGGSACALAGCRFFASAEMNQVHESQASRARCREVDQRRHDRISPAPGELDVVVKFADGVGVVMVRNAPDFLLAY